MSKKIPQNLAKGCELKPLLRFPQKRNEAGFLTQKKEPMKTFLNLFFLLLFLGTKAEDTDIPNNIIRLCNQGVAHYTNGALDSAAGLFVQAEQLALMLPDKPQQALSFEKIGTYYQRLDFRNPAIRVFEKALAIQEELRDTISVVRLLDEMAGIHMSLPDYQQALAYCQKARLLEEKQKGLDKLAILPENPDSCYSMKGAPASFQMEDTLIKAAFDKDLKNLEVDHAFEQQIMQIELQEKIKNTQYQHQLEKEQAMLRTTIITLLLAVILIITLFIFYQTKRRSNKLLSKLNEEIRTRQSVLEQQKNKLEELDRMKSHFFTNISHEFRTPLTIIDGAVHEIKQSGHSAGHELEVISRNNHHLLQLVNQILDLRKLEVGKMKLDLIHGDILPYLQYLLESFQTLAASRKITLHLLSIEPSIHMDYDREKLLHIVSNLLSNALKYTPEGKDIYVIIKKESSDQEQLQFTVQDSGIGIPENKLPFIFDRFYQLDDWIYRGEESTGIGLALTKEFTNLMGGTLIVESTVGQGSTFTILLPITHKASKKTGHNQIDHLNLPAENEIQDENIMAVPINEELPLLLIIEDNPDVVRYTVSFLQNHYQIAIARDGEEGIAKALEIIPDLIISDLKMPNKNGYEVCRILKADKRTSHIPIVLVSAIAEQEIRNEGFRFGADAYLIKPFNREELFIRLEKLIELRHRLQERYQNLDPVTGSDDPAYHMEDAFIVGIQETIKDHLGDETFGIPELCRAIGMSRSQLHNKIKALTKRSTSHYIRGIRLRHAKEILRKSGLNVTQVAFEVGFRNPSYFTRTFTEEFGLSPKEYLNQSK